MTWLSSIGRALDPTRAGSVVRRGLRQLDPTLQSSAVRGIGRQLDVTNKNSIAGKVAPYAVGLIPGVGLPLAAGLGAGLRTAQGIGRGASIGEIAGDALRGAGEASLTRGIARMAMPGTFAPSSVASGIAPAPGTGALASGPRLDVPLNSAASWSPGEAANIAANSVVPAAPVLPAMPTMTALPMTAPGATAAAGRGTLSGIGSFLTRQPTTIPSILGTGAQIYGASQLGAAEDERLRMEREQFDEEKKRRAGRIGFSEWQRRRTAPGGAPTV
jgi:hypothetical protein